MFLTSYHIIHSYWAHCAQRFSVTFHYLQQAGAELIFLRTSSAFEYELLTSSVQHSFISSFLFSRYLKEQNLNHHCSFRSTDVARVLCTPGYLIRHFTFKTPAKFFRAFFLFQLVASRLTLSTLSQTVISSLTVEAPHSWRLCFCQ